MPRHQLIEVWVIGTKEKEVLLVGLDKKRLWITYGKQ